MQNIDTLRKNGILELKLPWWGFWQKVSIVGGPFKNFVNWMDGPGGIGRARFGVCLLEGGPLAQRADAHLPINDFSIPKQPAFLVEVMVLDAFKAALDGKITYVGCMGGFGRTGLFLSILAKAAGVSNPVDYVRENYYPSAVETDEQEAYVENFDVVVLQKAIGKAARAYFWKSLFHRG